MDETEKTSEPHLVTMNRLRERMLVLASHGAIVGAANRDFMNATLNQIMKEVENDRIQTEEVV